MSSWFAGPRPSHAADPKVKENTKKENAKKENALFFSGREGAEGPGSGREEGSGISSGEGEGRRLVGGGCRSGVCQNLSECYATVYVYVYEMYANLMSQLNGVLAVSTWCRWCGLAQCVCIARPVINYSSSIRFCHWHIHVIHCNACSRDQSWPSREPRASCASARAASHRCHWRPDA